jgi:nicotinic acid mononucleotide adenylyltransferase
MAELAFGELPGVSFDFSDLVAHDFSPTIDVQERYAKEFPGWQIWHAVGGDLVRNGHLDQSLIQTKWKKGQEVWEKLNFAVINHPGCPVDESDHPPHSKLINLPQLYGRSTIIRQRLAKNLPIDELVHAKILQYIVTHNLYGVPV